MNDVTGYLESNQLPRRDVCETLAKYLGRLSWSPGDLVLDIGCGPGDVTAEVLLPTLPGDIGKVVGIDLSHAMVDHAAATRDHPKLCFTQMDIATKQLGEERLRDMADTKQLGEDKHGDVTGNYRPHRPLDGVFNKVFSFFCFHWVQDHKLAFKNVYELMKPGGEGLVVLVSHCPILDMYEVMAENPKWSPYMKDVRNYISPYYKSSDPGAEFSAVLHHVGFQVNTCINERRIFPYEMVSHLRKIVGAVTPFIRRMPEHLRDAYLNDCISELNKMESMEFFDRKDPHKDGHVIRMKYGLIIAHFTKTTCAASSAE